MSADLGAVSGATVGLIGGYGDVGRKLAGQISAERPILIAGRSLEKAKAFATRLSGSISVAQLDTSVSDAAKQLAGDISIAVLMAPDPNVRFTSTCVDLGINVVWITTDFSAEEQLSALNEPAKKRGVAIVRGAGVAPGLSTLLAYDLLCKVPDARYLDFGVTLGLGEKHGGGAIDWFLSAEVPKEFGVAGRDIARFEHADGKKFKAFNFAFPDPIILGLREVSVGRITHWVALKPGWITPLVGRFMSTEILKSKFWRKRVAVLMNNLSFGSNHCGVFAVVSRENGQTITHEILAHGQSKLTATMAHLAVRALSMPGHPTGTIDMVDLVTLETAANAIKQIDPKAVISINSQLKLFGASVNGKQSSM